MRSLKARKKILITGGTGFIGSHLVRHLAESGHNIQLLVRPVTLVPESLGIAARDIHTADGSQECLNDILAQNKPQVVIHLAAHWKTAASESPGRQLVEANVLGPVMLLEAMQRAGVSQLLNAASYWQYYENREYSPVDLYAASKQAFEAFAQYYAEACQFQVCHLVIPDTYGMNDPRPKILQLLRQAMISGQNLAMSPGNQRLSLLYIDDIVEGFSIALDLLDRQATPISRYSLQGKDAYSLREIVSLIEEVSGRSLNIEWAAIAYRKRDMMLPVDRWPTLPGWTAKITLREGLRRLFTEGN